MNPTLDEIAHREVDPILRTDKRTGDGMGYTPVYERYFSPLRDEPITILEIGVNTGGSMLMWLDYFTNGKVIGVDIVPKTRPPESHRYRFIQGDQQSIPFWNSVIPSLGKLDIVIDDGGHIAGQIENSFKCLWPIVKPGGYYCIEDLGAAYNPEAQTPGLGNHLQFIKDFIDHINLGRAGVDSLHFYRELAIIKKK
jgi:methyltransferase family protein